MARKMKDRYNIRLPGLLSLYSESLRDGTSGDPMPVGGLGEIFRTYPDRPWGPPGILYNGYLNFPVGKDGRGVMLTTHAI